MLAIWVIVVLLWAWPSCYCSLGDCCCDAYSRLDISCRWGGICSSIEVSGNAVCWLGGLVAAAFSQVSTGSCRPQNREVFIQIVNNLKFVIPQHCKVIAFSGFIHEWFYFVACLSHTISKVMRYSDVLPFQILCCTHNRCLVFLMSKCHKNRSWY